MHESGVSQVTLWMTIANSSERPPTGIGNAVECVDLRTSVEKGLCPVLLFGMCIYSRTAGEGGSSEFRLVPEAVGFPFLSFLSFHKLPSTPQSAFVFTSTWVISPSVDLPSPPFLSFSLPFRPSQSFLYPHHIMFASHRNRALPNTPHRQVSTSPNVPTTPPSPSTLAGTPSAPSRTWSIGTIPICYDQNPSIPSRSFPDDSPTFPSSGGSAASSPNLNRSPRIDSDLSPALRPSPSSTLKKLWKGRFMGGATDSEESPRPDPRPRYRGLNITTSAAPPLPGPSKARTSISTPLPHILETKSTLGDDLPDNDDALSCFSLSAYMRADSDGEGSRHTTPALGQAITFDTPPLPPSIEVAASMSSSQPTDSTYVSSEPSSRMGTSSSCETAVSDVSEVTTPVKSHHPFLTSGHQSPETPITFSYPRPGFGLSPTNTLSFDEAEATRASLDKQLPSLPPQARQKELRIMTSKQSIDSGTRTSSSLSTLEEAERQATIAAQLRAVSPRIEFLKDTRVELHIDQVRVHFHTSKMYVLTMNAFTGRIPVHKACPDLPSSFIQPTYAWVRWRACQDASQSIQLLQRPCRRA